MFIDLFRFILSVFIKYINAGEKGQIINIVCIFSLSLFGIYIRVKTSLKHRASLSFSDALFPWRFLYSLLMCLSFSLVQAITFLSDLLVFLSSKALRCLSLPFPIYLPTTISLPTIGALRSSFPCNIVLTLAPTSLFILYSSLHRSPFLSLVRAQSPCPCRTHVTRERRMSVLSRFTILAALAASSFIECNEKEHVRSIFISPPLQYRVPRHPLFT